MIIGRVRKMIPVTKITTAYNELTSQPSAAPLPQGSLDKSRQRGQDDSVETFPKRLRAVVRLKKEIDRKRNGKNNDFAR